jgi:hypothetical protein
MTLDNHGSPHDRGGADSYYHRPRSPHWWPQGTYNGTKIDRVDMTPEEVTAYNEGFDENESRGDFKDWGHEDEAREAYDPEYEPDEDEA